MKQYQPGDTQPVPENYGGQIFAPPAQPESMPVSCEKPEKGWFDRMLSHIGIGKWINADTLVLVAAALLLSDDRGDDDLLLLLLLLFFVR